MGGGGGEGSTPLAFHMIAKIPPISAKILSPEIIDNTRITMPQVRADDGWLYIMTAPISIINPSTIQYTPKIAPIPPKNHVINPPIAEIASPARNSRIPPIRDKTNAAVGFSLK